MALDAGALAQTPAETITYTYDALGRLTNVAHAGVVNNGVTATYTLDAAGNRSKVAVTTSSPTVASLAVSDASVTEGGSLVFTVTRSGPVTGTNSVIYATANGTAVAGSDYTSASNTLTFAPGETTKTVSITTLDDSAVEVAKTMTLNLSNATGGATIADAQGVGTINDNDGAGPSFSVSDASATEGGTLVFTVTKTGTTSSTLSVDFSTSGSTAAPGIDYTIVSGTLTFAPGDTAKSVSVATIDDSGVENAETMTLNLSNATAGATISDAQGVGTINDNDSSSGPVTINLSSGSGANLRSAANSNGYTGTSGVTYNFVVPGGTTITGSPGGGPAIDTGTWPAGVTLTLAIDGTVSGGGGSGGNGGVGNTAAGAGGAGGDGVSCGTNISITVGGTLEAGGGGGGGGGGATYTYPGGVGTVAGGGGGGGAPNGPGGLGAVGTGNTSPPGSAGTTSGGGAGGTGGGAPYGGNGGTYATAGAAGVASGAGAGGAAGYAVRKNGTSCTASGNITGTVG